jgi:hypothetical protein
MADISKEELRKEIDGKRLISILFLYEDYDITGI